MKFSQWLLCLSLAVPVFCASRSTTPNSSPSTEPAPLPHSGAISAADVYARAIEKLHGSVVDPADFAPTIEGFEQYLAKSGISAVTAAELTRPNHPHVAARLSFTAFLPRQEWWPRGAALALLVQELRSIAREPVHIRNWWRPAAYNADPAVGGARNGDHPTANAVDLDYASRAGRMRAERWLRALDRSARWLELSLGLGDRTTHVGIASPKGRREWHYAGWRPATAA